MIELRICRTCFFPFRAGINFSILSVNKKIPILSLFFSAENIKLATISKDFLFLGILLPKLPEPERSKRKYTCRSRSSTYSLT